MAEYFKPEVDYYDTAEEILREDDIIETDVVVQGWAKKLRIRALNFGQMTEINQKSTNEKGELVEKDFVLNTLRHGIIRPKFNSAQLEKLLEKNGETVKQLSDEIWDLGRISKKIFDDYVAALKEKDESTKKT